jgi:hypothetical protein
VINVLGLSLLAATIAFTSRPSDAAQQGDTCAVTQSGSWSWRSASSCKVSVNSKYTHKDVANGKLGVLNSFTTAQGQVIQVYSQYLFRRDGSLGPTCKPNKTKSCEIEIKTPDKSYWWWGEARYDKRACHQLGTNNCLVFGRSLANKEPPVLAWSGGAGSVFQQQNPVTTTSSSNPTLGPIVKTVGQNKSMQTVRKNHRVITSSMRGGKNLLGQGVVQMQVLSHEPGDTKGFVFWLEVNCNTRNWRFVENNAKLMGGGIEMFGKVRGEVMGPWACSKYGFRY